MPNHHDTKPALGGKWAVVVFIFTLLAFVVETQLTQVRFESIRKESNIISWIQYVQTTLNFRQPFFML
jgi:hypothetical protein